MAKGVKFNKPPSFASRVAANTGQSSAPQKARAYNPPKGGASTKGQGTVPRASSGAQPLVGGKGGKGKAMAGRALKRTPVAF